MLKFLFKYKKIIWCKCLVSGSSGDLDKFFFLKIENKFSKAGYQSKQTIKYGEILLLIWYVFIKHKANNKPKKYDPPSPK